MLDRSRPYGQVYGDARCSFMQDDRMFDARGMEVDAAGLLIIDPIAPVIPTEVAPDVAVVEAEAPAPAERAGRLRIRRA